MRDKRKTIGRCRVEFHQGYTGIWFWRVVKPDAGRLAGLDGQGETFITADLDAQQSIRKADPDAFDRFGGRHPYMR
jgi:hypothetical protein